jgi:hypothetical protein
MFTGIVEEMGVVEALEERHDVPLWDGTIGTGTQLTIHCSTVLEGAYVGYVVFLSIIILFYIHTHVSCLHSILTFIHI